MGSGDANNVREWLVQSGLRHHTAAFASISEEAFKGLMMQVKITCDRGCQESWSMNIRAPYASAHFVCIPCQREYSNAQYAAVASMPWEGLLHISCE